MVDRIILVGMMGAGKSTVGRSLAACLGWAYIDSDEQVVARTGRTVPELFAERGEAAFRAEESLALSEALSGDEPVVVSAAGGVVLAAEHRALLTRSGTVVWLRADPRLLVQRVGDGRGRPLLGDDPASRLIELYEVRRPLYESVAEVTVDVDGLSAAEVVDRILAEGRLGRPGVGGGPA